MVDPRVWRYTMTTADVSWLFEVTGSRIRQLDEELRPIRRHGTRRYDPVVVREVYERRMRKAG